MKRLLCCVLVAAAALHAGCGSRARLPVEAVTGTDPELVEPKKSLLPTVDIAPAVRWPEGRTPVAAPGFAVNAFATGLEHPRWLYVLPNGDVLVAETNRQPAEESGLRAWIVKQIMKRAGAAVPSADRITLLRDADGDGVAEVRSVFAENLVSPFGMALVGSDFYVANTDALVRFRYEPGALRLAGAPVKLVDLPAGKINYHWTKNVIANAAGTRLYITVGSNSNVGEKGMEHERGRAAIHEFDIASGSLRLYASGLRNPNGLDWHPRTGELWTTVNERDELGGDLVPDYLTTVDDGDFYGWPWSYFGDIVDERVRPARPDLVAQARRPAYALGAHVAALGLAFYDAGLLPARYREGAFIGLHGSWNRRPPSGYNVVFVPFAAGRPTGKPETVLGGFLSDDSEAYGRPVGVVVAADGAVLVADDVGNTVWRLRPAE